MNADKNKGKRPTGIIYVMPAALLTVFAHAQSNPDLEQCRAITNNADLAIKHCTRAID